MDKVYIRKGCRFVAIPNVVGMFYDGVNFTKEKTSKSYAFCYDQNGNTAMLTMLEAEYGTFSWYKAQEDRIKPYHLPSREQILLARKRYKSFPINITIWTCDMYTHFSSYAFDSTESCGGIFSCPNYYYEKVLVFFETEIV